MRDYIRKPDVLIAVDVDGSEAQIEITSGTVSPGAVEQYSNAFFGTGFEGFEAGDFLVEEKKRETALRQIEDWIKARWEIYAICHNEGEIERLRDVLRDNEIDVDACQFAVGSLNQGFIYPEGKLAILSDAEIFGRYQSPSARRLALRRSRLKGSRVPIDFSEIAEGDLVVHLEHGIGKYRGIQTLTQNNTKQEVVVLEFANESRLYVPFEQAFLISRYVGIGKRLPELSVMGDSRWSPIQNGRPNLNPRSFTKKRRTSSERYRKRNKTWNRSGPWIDSFAEMSGLERRRSRFGLPSKR
jgi:transcription-repair coupling factor (superfamily II helicase)